MANTVINVSTMAGLKAALASSTGGETILLQGGNYGAFRLDNNSGFNLNFPSNVTIASATPANPAIFTSVNMTLTKNLTFDGLMFDYTNSPTDQWYTPNVYVNTCPPVLAVSPSKTEFLMVMLVQVFT